MEVLQFQTRDIIGQEIACYVQRHLVETLQKTAAFAKQDYSEALKAAFVTVDQSLITSEGKKELADIAEHVCKYPGMFGRVDPEELVNSSGCTACVALITRTEIYIANAGTSRAVLAQGAAAVPVSIDHNPSVEGESQRILKAGGTVEDGKVKGILPCTRAFGDFEYKTNKKLQASEQLLIAVPEVRVEKLTHETEFLLLACDGIWKCLSNEKAIALIKDKLRTSATQKPSKLNRYYVSRARSH